MQSQEETQNREVKALKPMQTSAILPELVRRSKNNRRQKQKPFAAIELQTLECEEWLVLSFVVRHVYNTLKTFYRGEHKSFMAPFSALLKRSGIRHGRTIQRALNELEARGWLSVVRYAKHGKRKGLRVKPNEYTLTFNWDYKRW